MPRIGFYNENEARAYPLIDSDLGLAVPWNAIVDFGCLFIFDAGFDSSSDYVWLYSLEEVGSNYEVIFRTSAANLAGVELVFTVPNNAPEYARFSAEYAPLGRPVWLGYLSIGQVVALAEATAGGPLVDDDGITKVEPATIQSLIGRLVTAVRTGNAPRHVASAPAGCPGWAAEWPLSSYAGSGFDQIIPYGSELLSDIEMFEGSNCAIEVRERDNQVIIGAAVGAGSGEPCNELPLFSSEAPPDGGLLLTGGPGCSQVVQSINGITGRVIKVTPGPGITVGLGPTPHSLIIRPDLKTVVPSGGE